MCSIDMHASLTCMSQSIACASPQEAGPFPAPTLSLHLPCPSFSLHPDHALSPMLCSYVAGALGQRYVEPLPAALSHVFEDAGPVTPVIFVLSHGTDPTAELIR